ncbi:CHAD domain-containing protein [Luteimonas granuli]|uniref:CHAD domain-containing protein n=1 Tax=Luteimonas granuli TaxID=1176533 RepID=A0A518N427_9GAMM|nr:CHAD domain-containing protein [Luteimonas granuli]QDW66675.1 CHAD domain-containing protein [Luteimonas granuli]
MGAPADKGLPDIGPLLGDDAQRAARLVAIELQARIRAAHARLGDPGDRSALHDFRVAVRRLRSWLDMDVVLPGRMVPERALKRLRKVSKATNASRDHEVFAKWLRGRLGALSGDERAAADWVLAVLGARASRSDPGVGGKVEREYARSMELLDDSLPWYRSLHHVERGQQVVSFAASLAALLRLDVAELRRRVTAVAGEDDGKAIHRARIAGKRLRYHLEPVAAAVPGVPECLQRLRTLQDLLGDFTDGLVWIDIVREAGKEAHDDAVRQGLDRIVARIGKRGARRFRDIRKYWLTGEPALFAGLSAVEAWLDARAPATDHV